MEQKNLDRYEVTNRWVTVKLSVSDDFLTGEDEITLIHHRDGWQETVRRLRILPAGRTGLPKTAQGGNTAVAGKGYGLLFLREKETTQLIAHADHFRAERTLDVHITVQQTPDGRLQGQGTVELGEECLVLNWEETAVTRTWRRTGNG